MLVSGSDILNYQGNAALGGAGQGGYYGDADTKQMADAITNLTYVNHQKNRAVWEQKIKDRDDSQEQLKAGNIKMDEVPPQYRQQLLQMRDNFKQVYLDNGGDLKSNPEAWSEFNDKLAEFSEASTAAKSKLLEYNREKELAAKETNPLKKQKMLENMERNMQTDVYQPYQPYQQTLDWEPAKVDLEAPIVPSAATREGYYDVTKQTTDLEKYREMYYQQWVNNKSGDTPWHMESFLTGFLGNDGIRPPEAVAENMELVNRKLAQINEQLKLTPADPRYLTPLKGMVGPDGKMQLSDNTADSVYKIMLAKNFKNATDKTLNLNYAKADKIGSEIAKNKADVALTGAKIGTEKSKQRLNDAKAKTQGLKNTALKEMIAPAQVFDEIFSGKTQDYKTTNGNYVTRINRAYMSKGLMETLGIQPMNQDGDYNLVPSKIRSGDELLTEDFVQNGFKRAMANGGKTKAADGKVVTVKNIFEYLAAKGVDDYEVEVVGKDDDGNIVRSNKLNSWIKQRKDMKLTGEKGLLQDDDEIEVEQD